MDQLKIQETNQRRDATVEEVKEVMELKKQLEATRINPG